MAEPVERFIALAPSSMEQYWSAETIKKVKEYSSEEIITLTLTEKQYWKLREILDDAQDCGSSLGNYASLELKELQEAVRNQQVFD